MAKIRVYELARDLGIESRVLLMKMKDLNIEVSSHQSTLSPTQIEKIKSSLSIGKPTVVVRRRKKVEEDEVHPQVVEPTPHAEKIEEERDHIFSSENMEHVDIGSTQAIPSPEEAEHLEPTHEEEVRDHSFEGEDSVTESHDRTTNDALPQTSSVSEDFKGGDADFPPVQEEKRAEQNSLEQEEGDGPAQSRVVTEAINPLSEEEKGVTMKAEKMGLSKKSEFVSATVIRRATPEEEVALNRPKEDKKGKIKRIEIQPSAAASPIRSIGSPGSRPAQAPNKEKDWGSREPAFKFADDELIPIKSERGVDRKKEFTKLKNVEEEEKPLVKPVINALKRKSVSTRSLLDAVEREEDIDEDGARRKTVYTPSLARNRKKEIKKKKDLKSTQITTPRAAYRVVKMPYVNIVVSELALQMHVKVSELLKKFMDLGMMVTANQSVDVDSATLVASEFGYEVKRISKTAEEILGWDKESAYEKLSRPPIVTVMGHVDHGKTTILDSIRKSDVANNEAGGITQHIAAYTVESNGFKTAFLDTPGHAAFSAMRERGAQLTDIVVLVVAADDGVMPQTKEAIAHAQKSGVPIVVALNKVDKPNLNFDRIYTELSELGIQAEEWGGDVQCVKVSAKKMLGIKELLEAIHVQCEILELKARVEGRAKGIVVEAHLDKGRGSIATVMVTEGRLQVGDLIVVGKVFGRVRAMIDHNGKSLKEATPSTPVGIVGLTELPMSGDALYVVSDEKTAREVVNLRIDNEREALLAAKVPTTLETLMSRTVEDQLPRLLLIVKADTQGSVQAIIQSIAGMHSKMIKPEVIFKGVGDVTESDLTLAQTSGADIIAFNVKISKSLADKADQLKVSLKSFSIIYELLDAVKDLMVRKLPPILNEVVQGHAEVRNTINVPKIGVIAGSAITDGKITRNSMLRVLRNGETVYSGKVSSLKRFKDDVKEVLSGFECGIGIEGYKDIQIGDVIESYMIEEKPAILDI